MLIYCIITWLMGIGIFIQIRKKEKLAKLYKKSDNWAYLLVWLFMPVLLPLIIGLGLGEAYETDPEKPLFK